MRSIIIDEEDGVTDSMRQKLTTLIVGRLLIVFLLLIASWMWQSGGLRIEFDEFPRDLFAIFLISVGLTIIYFIVLRMSSEYYWQIRTQFFIDILLITILVWRTGDASSPYITLYVVLIATASLFMGKRATLLLSGLCVFCFTALCLLTYTGVVASASGIKDPRRIAQTIGFDSIVFFVVGLLSAQLAERYASTEELKATSESLANLRVLHARIIESIRSGLVTIDLEGTIYTFNKTAEEITGYKSKEMRGQSIYDIFGDISREIETGINEELSKVDSQQRHEVGFMTPDGFVIQIGYSIAPLFTESGEKSGLILTFQDLTEIRSMEESVRRKDRLAAVGRVAAGLAHEIRNPLGAMSGAIQVLELKYKDDPASANLMEIILRESDRLNEIITNFLRYARPKESKFEMTDIRQPLTDTGTLLSHSPNVGENHTINVSVPDNPINIPADVDQLKQIFWNLARNALQAMPDGGNLDISLTEKKNYVSIIFKDTGCGMSPTQVEKLFEPFSKSTTGGTGLGLSIVYQIVRDHSGTINVQSKEGSGTIITLRIPTDFIDRPPELGEGNKKLKGFLNISPDDPTI